MMMAFFIFQHSFFQLFKAKVKANKVLFYGQAGAVFLYISLNINLRCGNKAIEMGQKMDIFTFLLAFATLAIKETINKFHSPCARRNTSSSTSQQQQHMIIVRGLFLHVNYIKYVCVQLPHKVVGRERGRRRNGKTQVVSMCSCP